MSISFENWKNVLLGIDLTEAGHFYVGIAYSNIFYKEAILPQKDIYSSFQKKLTSILVAQKVTYTTGDNKSPNR